MFKPRGVIQVNAFCFWAVFQQILAVNGVVFEWFFCFRRQINPSKLKKVYIFYRSDLEIYLKQVAFEAKAVFYSSSIF